jgi:hypothetical protein
MSLPVSIFLHVAREDANVASDRAVAAQASEVSRDPLRTDRRTSKAVMMTVRINAMKCRMAAAAAMVTDPWFSLRTKEAPKPLGPCPDNDGRFALPKVDMKVSRLPTAEREERM